MERTHAPHIYTTKKAARQGRRKKGGGAMYMTVDEVTNIYKRGGCTDRQIKILAELNNCDTSEIVEILVKAGYKMSKKYAKQEELITLKPIIINGTRYCKPRAMTIKEWDQHVEHIRDQQIEREYHEVQAALIQKDIDELLEELELEKEYHEVAAEYYSLKIEQLERRVQEKIQGGNR